MEAENDVILVILLVLPNCLRETCDLMKDRISFFFLTIHIDMQLLQLLIIPPKHPPTHFKGVL